MVGGLLWLVRCHQPCPVTGVPVLSAAGTYAAVGDVGMLTLRSLLTALSPQNRLDCQVGVNAWINACLTHAVDVWRRTCSKSASLEDMVWWQIVRDSEIKWRNCVKFSRSYDHHQWCQCLIWINWQATYHSKSWVLKSDDGIASGDIAPVIPVAELMQAMDGSVCWSVRYQSSIVFMGEGRATIRSTALSNATLIRCSNRTLNDHRWWRSLHSTAVGRASCLW